MNPVNNSLTFGFGAAVFLAQFLQSEGGVNATNLTVSDGIGTGNQTVADADKADAPGLFSTQFLICAGLAVIATIIAVIACKRIASSNEYASG